MIAATSVPFFKDLAQYDFDNANYDFHNDYSFEKLSYASGLLRLVFKSLIGRNQLSLMFTDVNIMTIDFFNVNDVENLTLDILYRGRAEVNGALIELLEDGRGYFYLEFYEGQTLEFWATGFYLE